MAYKDDGSHQKPYNLINWQFFVFPIKIDNQNLNSNFQLLMYDGAITIIMEITQRETE